MSDKKVSSPEYESPFYRWNKPGYKFDVAKAFKEANPGVCNDYHHSRFTMTPEKDKFWSWYFNAFESRFAHGYPYTFALQGGIIYLCAIYTAREQGLISKTGNQFFFNIFRSHWFDWITFLKRAGIFGIAGGLVLGTVFFGDPTISLKRIHNTYATTKRAKPATPMRDHYFWIMDNK